MVENIHNILNQLGAAIEAQIGAANDHANAMKAQNERLINGLAALIGQPISNDNERDGENADRSETAIAPSTSKKRQTIADEAFLNALGNDWQTAAHVRKLLSERDIKVAEGTIYNRMRKLVAAYPDMIEAAAKPEMWRLKSGLRSPEVAPRRSKPAAHKKMTSKKTPRTSASAVSVQCANDNASPLYKPSLHHGDCLKIMRNIPDGSVDLVLADLPYGTTGLSIDHCVPMKPLWNEYRRIIKPTGNIVLFAAQPFANDLINAGRDLFKYDLVWKKQVATGFQFARHKPLKSHELILVFSPGTNASTARSARRATFNPQGAVEVERVNRTRTDISYLSNASHPKINKPYRGLSNCPRSVLEFDKRKGNKNQKSHPFSKPIDLLENLIRTYSNAGEVVLDNTMGGGSTCVAAMNTGRRAIGIEMDRGWFEFASARVESAMPSAMSDVESKPIVPISQSPQSEIYQGDCLEVMKQMPSKSVDLIVTSPIAA